MTRAKKLRFWIAMMLSLTMLVSGVPFMAQESVEAAPAPFTNWVYYNPNVTPTGKTGITDVNLMSISYIDGKYLVGTDAGDLLSSSNAKDWVIQKNFGSGMSNVNGIAYGGNKYVVVGDYIGNAKIAVSTDNMISFAAVSPPSGITSRLNAVTYGGGQFVAVGNSGKIITSTDGENWTSQTSGETINNLSRIVYAAGQYIVVGDFGTLLTSPDAVTWTKRDSGQTSSALYDVIFDGSKFVTVGRGQRISTSSDGVNWTLVTPYASTHYYGVAGVGGQFVAVGANGVVLTSSDGVVRINDADSTKTTNLNKVAYDGTGFLAVGNAGQAVYGIPAMITAQPTDVSVGPGDSVTLSVTATGNNLSYQWYSNTQKSSSGATLISGATSSSYSPPTSSAGTKYYYCVVKNAFTSAMGDGTMSIPSKAAKVEVTATQNSTISPSTGSFDKKTSAQADVTTTLTLNGNTLSSIANGATSLTAGTDYSISGSSVTIKSSYLAQQSVGTTTLTFTFSAGNTQSLAISVSDTTPQNSTISPSTGNFDKKTSAQADVTTTLTLNGNTLSSIANGAASLTAGTDYSTSGSSVTIKKSYLAQQSVGTTTLTFTFSAGNTQSLAISVSDTTPQNSTISPSTGSFDKKTSAQADVTTTLTLNGNTLSSIANGAASLTADTDYSTSGSSVTIKKSYLAQQSVGTTILTFTFSAGNTQSLAISVSDSTPLTHAATPNISVQPGDITASIGGTANLTVSAAVPAGSLSYQWYSNTTNSTTNGSIISGATADTYSAPTTPTGITYYYCVITNTDSTATGNTTASIRSNAARVTINDLTNAAIPAITTQPADATVTAGGAVNLSVSAAVSTGSLSYQWYSNTTNSTTNGAIIGSAAGSTYSAPTGTVGTTYYYCVITNTDNAASGNTTASAISRAASVTVTAAPLAPSAYGGRSGSANPGERTVAIIVKNIQGEQISPANLAIKRDTQNGTVTDKVILTEDKAKETVQKALESKKDIAVIMVTDVPEQKADKVEIQVPKESMNQLADKGMAITIVTEKVQVQLPKETVAALKDQDNKLEIREQKEQAKVGNTQSLMLQLATGSQMLGTPIVIDSNITSGVWLTLPLDKKLIPNTEAELSALLNSLAVLIEHSDGENKIDKGQIKYDADGKPEGISVYVNKFSTFTVIGLPEVIRISGEDRIQTAISVSRTAYPNATKNVVLANGYEFADALTGVTLGAKLEGPILLTAKETLPSVTLEEIKRLQAQNIYIVGGPAVVSQEIEEDLKSKGYSVYRLSGEDRMATAVAIGNHIVKKETQTQTVDTVVIAYGYDYADALAGATFAAKYHYPILLTGTEQLDQRINEALKEWQVKKVILIGGSGVIAETVEAELWATNLTVTRLGGQDRYETARRIIEYFAPNAERITLTTGNNFPDALAGALLAAKKDSPIMLFDKNTMTAEVKAYVKSLISKKQPYILGGEKVLPAEDIFN